jgi:hypothetical protein
MAQKSEIIDAIEALAVHCRPTLMSVDQRTLWMADWCSDLTQHPIEAILAACRKYRHSGATKFPTAGQLIPLVKASLPAEQTPDEGPWRPLSEPEYDALSLRAKIRHQLILASDARSKAGPMFRNTQSVMARAGGEHIQASDMPDTWRRWTDIARGHEAEAARLRSYLHAKPSTDHARQQEAR